ncbi:MAG: magnesium transporter [Bacteroidia bacterium]|nr:magnesium transporter [Bacteroidia bacterium]MCC7534291.1 magnesium transporter [Bacteroidia bacterium]
MEVKSSNELVKEFLHEISLNNTEYLKEKLQHIHAQDIALILDKTEIEDARDVIACMDSAKAAEVLIEMKQEKLTNLLASYSSDEIANHFIQYMESNNAVYVLNHIPLKKQEEVISNLTDVEFASSLLSLISYEEYTAGSMMAVELVKANSSWTVAQCIDEIRSQSDNITKIYVVYVIDDFERLIGLITLKNLILSNPHAKLIEVTNTDVISVNTSADSESIANIFDKYNLIALPVVNAINQLVGVITVDDIVEIIKEEANEDYQLMSGITENVDATDKVWILSRARLPWLLIGLLGGIISSRFIEMFEGTLKIHPEMAFFMPLIAAMGGNVGVQSSAIVVQGLANDTLGTRNILSKILKEIRVALLNGLTCSILLLGYNALFSNSYDLSFTVSVALFSVIICASILGTFVPMALNKFKIDPAIATGPFITTTNDIIGLAIYFTTGRLLYATF